MSGQRLECVKHLLEELVALAYSGLLFSLFTSYQCPTPHIPNSSLLGAKHFHSARPLGRSESWCWCVCMFPCLHVCLSSYIVRRLVAPRLDLLVTFLWPVNDFSVTFQWSFSDLSVTFRWPFGDLLVTFQQPFGDLSVTFLWPFGDLSVIFRWYFGDLSMTFRWPFRHL